MKQELNLVLSLQNVRPYLAAKKLKNSKKAMLWGLVQLNKAWKAKSDSGSNQFRLLSEELSASYKHRINKAQKIVSTRDLSDLLDSSYSENDLDDQGMYRQRSNRGPPFDTNMGLPPHLGIIGH